MGFFFDRIVNRKGAHIPHDTALVITEQGKDALSEYGGDVKGRILLALETRGSSDVEGISKASGLSVGEIERAVPGLIKNRYIRLTSAGAVGEDL